MLCKHKDFSIMFTDEKIILTDVLIILEFQIKINVSFAVCKSANIGIDRKIL